MVGAGSDTGRCRFPTEVVITVDAEEVARRESLEAELQVMGYTLLAMAYGFPGQSTDWVSDSYYGVPDRARGVVVVLRDLDEVEDWIADHR